MRYIYLSFILLIFSPLAHAGPFDPTITDKSIELLGEIFGNIGNIVSGKPSPALQAVFDQLNWAILTISIIVLGYITIVSLVNTAQEGQVMGKKWSSAWIPVKSLLGILLMVPIAGSGYSFIQVAIMWIVVQGVGLADNIWDTILDYLAKGMGVTSTLKINEPDKIIVDDSAKKLFDTMVKSSVCEQALIAINKGKTYDKIINNRDANINSDITIKFGNKAGVHVTDPAISGTGIAAKYTGNINIGIKGVEGVPEWEYVCGKYSISAGTGGYNNVNPRTVYNKQAEAFFAMHSIVKQIAARIVTAKADEDPIRITNSLYGYATKAAKNYKDILMTQVIPRPTDRYTEKVVSEGKKGGWTVAGSYYFQLYRSQVQDLLPDVKNIIPLEQPSTVANFLKDPEKRFIEERLKIADEYIDRKSFNESADKLYAATLHTNNMVQGGGLFQAFIDSILNTLSNFSATVLDLFINAIDTYAGSGAGIQDPLVSLAVIGQGLMKLAELTYFAVTVGAILAAFLTLFPGINPFAMVFFVIFVAIGMVILAIMGMFYILGLTIGIYLPMLPYLIFTAAILGWLALVVEAIIAGPIIALGVIAPGQGEIGRTQHALQILTNIFLRPTLMILAFIFAAKLFAAIAKFIHYSYFATVTYLLSAAAGPGSTGSGAGGFAAHSSFSLVTPLIIIALYVGFITSIASRIFNLIHAIPDRILRWIGGAAETVGQEVGAITSKTQQEFDKDAAKTSKVAASYATKALKTMNAATEKMKKISSKGVL